MEGHDHQAMMSMSSMSQSDVFCQTMDGMPGMTMYMQGFRFSLWTANRDNPLPCINLLFPQWTLDNRTKFICAMMAVLLLGMTVELVMVMKLKYVALVKKRSHRERTTRNDPELVNQHNNSNTSSRSGRGDPDKTDNVRFVLTCFHSVQALVGYVLMLVVMSYSVELMLSAVLGLGLGYFMSYKKKVARTRSSSRGAGEDQQEQQEQQQHSIVETVTSSIPCCDFLQDVEDDDRDHSSYDTGTFHYSRINHSEQPTNSNVLHQRPVGSRNNE